MVDTKELLDRVDLRALAEEAGAVFGRNDSSVCPLHPGADNPAAFHVFRGQDGRWRWRCFTRCPEGENGGDAIAFYMRWRGVDFKTAVRELAQRAGLDVQELRERRSRAAEPPTPAPAALSPTADPPGEQWQARARAFTAYAQGALWEEAGRAVAVCLHKERGLTEETVRAWGLGYNPRDLWDDPERWGLTGKRIWCPRGVVVPGERDGATWYVKVRRPLPGDALARAVGAVERLPGVKYSGPRGGRATLFGTDRLAGLPVVLLAEGEFDAMLAWQEAGDLCDVLSPGGATHRLDAVDAVVLAGAWTILVAYDADAAGGEGGEYLRSVTRRAVVVNPPADDLTAYRRAGGDLRGWIAGQVAAQMRQLLGRLDEEEHPEMFAKWLGIYERAEAAAGRDAPRAALSDGAAGSGGAGRPSGQGGPQGAGPEAGGAFPVTLRFPAGLSVGVPAGRWRRLEGGEIEATYSTREELTLALAAAGRDDEAGRRRE